MSIYNIIIIILVLAVLGIGIFSYWWNQRLKKKLAKHRKEMEHQMYELAILKDLGERTGYSLNIQNIVDIITGSLHQFIEYSAVSYMLFQPDNIIFKVHLEESVSREFIDNIRDRMLKSLSALLNKDFKESRIEEIISGAILVDNVETVAHSFFNIPLVIGEKVEGVLTVAHTKAGVYTGEKTTILYKITQQASQAVTSLHKVIETEQRKLNAMVESITEGVVMTDKEYRILVANPAAKRIIGFDADKEATIFDFIDNLKDSFDIKGKLEESVKLDKILQVKEVIIKYRYYRIFVSPVKGGSSIKNDKEILGGVVIFQDITHDKELEKMREDFISMIVHELRSPLGGIKKSTEFLREKIAEVDKKKIDSYLELIYNDSSSMLGLVNDLLGVAKIESGKFEINPAPTNINKLIEDRVAFYQAAAGAKKITLDAKFSEDIPKEIKIDPIKITQVLNNLISNSLKFTDNGGTVQVQAFYHKKESDVLEEAKKVGINWMVKVDDKNISQEKDSIIISVTDSGVGIPAKKIPKLFNKFIQFKSTAKTEEEGTGLGLVIVKGIVKIHGGIINLASEEGKGTSFYFSLPLKIEKIDN